MKSTIIKKALLVSTALLVSLLICYGQDDSSDQVVGTWTKLVNERTITFTLTSDQKYQVEFVGDEKTDVLGTYAISGTQITFNDIGGEYSSPDPGVYDFKVNDTSITFTIVDDPAYGRSMLVEGKWLKGND